MVEEKEEAKNDYHRNREVSRRDHRARRQKIHLGSILWNVISFLLELLKKQFSLINDVFSN